MSTPRANGGVRNNIRFTLRSESRNSVNKTLRKVAERTTIAASGADALTLSSNVKSRTVQPFGLFIAYAAPGDFFASVGSYFITRNGRALIWRSLSRAVLRPDPECWISGNRLLAIMYFIM